jgi:large subunit ribosomal protein L4
VSTNLDVRGPDGTTTGTVELPGEIFDAQANISLMHQVVIAQQAAARQGTHSTKTRGQVSGGGAKPYRQKGTGRARQGSTRAPQFTGGGVVFGPTTRDYSQRTPKKMKAAALRGALSDRARNDKVHVVSHFVDGDTPSTREGRIALAAISEARHVLVVATRDDTQTWLSLRNLPNAHVLAPDQLNTYDVLLSDDVVFTQAAYEDFVMQRTGQPVVATAVARESEVDDVDESEVDEAPAAKPAKKAPAKKATAKKATKDEAAKDEAAKDEAAKDEAAKDEAADEKDEEEDA